MIAFDEAYARYLSALVQLDGTDDIVEKNALFKQLAAQLSELEKRLINHGSAAQQEEPEDCYSKFWI